MSVLIERSTLDALGLSLWIALCAVLVASPPAVVLAHVLARATFRGKSLIEALIAVPLVLPPTAIGYVLLATFARDGWLGEKSLGLDLDVLFTWKAAVLASAVVAFPLIARTARAAFEEVDPRLVLVARTHGFTRGRAWFAVTLPLARRGLLAALVLGFGRALGEFGATVIVAGNIPGRTQTLALAIFEGIQLSDDRRVRWLVVLTFVMALVVIGTAEFLARPRRPAARE